MPNIGIAITTTSARPHHKAYWENIALFSPLCVGMKIKFIHDVKGVAAAKNECLRELKDCDYVFLFDDDCFPIKEGWAQMFIDAHNVTGCHHFSYLHDYLHIRNVGAFNEAFGLYGYEHVEYSVRCKLAGLAPHHNVCPDDAPDFIYSMDLDSYADFDFSHVPTLSVQEMTEAHKVSVVKFTESIDNPIIYLPL